MVGVDKRGRAEGGVGRPEGQAGLDEVGRGAGIQDVTAGLRRFATRASCIHEGIRFCKDGFCDVAFPHPLAVDRSQGWGGEGLIKPVEPDEIDFVEVGNMLVLLSIPHANGAGDIGFKGGDGRAAEPGRLPSNGEVLGGGKEPGAEGGHRAGVCFVC